MNNLKFRPFPPLTGTPLVSCVIIFLNPRPFLLEAIESVLAQTYRHWELFLVDDGSSDGSTKVAQQYEQNYPQQVHYLEHPHHQNRGKNASRNLGIRHASGELIALLDADDVWFPDKLKEQVAAFQQYPEAGMVYGRSQSWYSWTGELRDQKKDLFVRLGVPPNSLVQPPALALNLLAGDSQTPTPCNAIFRREVFDAIGNFDENYHDIFEDQTFFIKVELYFPVFVAGNRWANYRKHRGSSFLQFNTESKRDLALRYTVRLKFFNWIETYLITQKYPHSEVWQSVWQTQKKLRKHLWLQQFRTYKLWRASLNIFMNVSRKILPQSWRDWLWQVIGKRLYVG